MSTKYPVATIVFFIITIFALSISLILFQQLVTEASKTTEKVLHGERIMYAEKQEVANAFRNLVTAFQECIYETDCMCDIYRLDFPRKYSIKIERS